GGTADLIAREDAEHMRKTLGQTVMVDNKPGGGANIGTAEVARARGDAYTLLLASPGPFAFIKHIYSNLGFDPVKDFRPIVYIADVPGVLLAHPKVPFRDFPGLIDYARKHPGEVRWGSPGVGSSGHLMVEQFMSLSGTQVTHIPYK